MPPPRAWLGGNGDAEAFQDDSAVIVDTVREVIDRGIHDLVVRVVGSDLQSTAVAEVGPFLDARYGVCGLRRREREEFG